MSIDLNAARLASLAGAGQIQAHVSSEVIQKAQERQETLQNVSLCVTLLTSNVLEAEASSDHGGRSLNAENIRLAAGRLVLKYLNGIVEGD